jgi:3-oxoacyl-[acyl-carrier-protein] synthase II
VIPQVQVGDAVGVTYSASGALQLAALLALWRDGSPDRFALATSMGPDGNVGCLLVRNRRAA